jgi:hypothetical protein
VPHAMVPSRPGESYHLWPHCCFDPAISIVYIPGVFLSGSDYMIYHVLQAIPLAGD